MHGGLESLLMWMQSPTMDSSAGSDIFQMVRCAACGRSKNHTDREHREE